MRFSEAKGHHVVSTADASTVGRVDGFLVEAAGARVTGLHLKKTEGDVDLLPYADIKGFGPDAVTVTAVDVLMKRQKDDPGADVLGVRVLTETGVDLGQVKDVEFDPGSGQIRAVLTKDAEIAGTRLLGLGSYALVVTA